VVIICPSLFPFLLTTRLAVLANDMPPRQSKASAQAAAPAAAPPSRAQSVAAPDVEDEARSILSSWAGDNATL